MMIARSAYAQLRYNPLLLVLTVAGLGLVFLAPPVLALRGSAAGVATAVLMAALYLPMLLFIGVRLCGRWPCRWWRCSIWAARSIRPGPIIGARAACGKGGRKPHDEQHPHGPAADHRRLLRQGSHQENFPPAGWCAPMRARR
jgi:hypothetical protein